MAERGELPVEHRDDARLGRMDDGVAEPIVAVVDRASRRPAGCSPAATASALHRTRVARCGRGRTGSTSARSGAGCTGPRGRSRRGRRRGSRHCGCAPARRSSNRRSCRGRPARCRASAGSARTRPGSELHDVEGGADHRIVLAERVGLRHRHVGVVAERLDHAILAIDLVRRGQELARRLLAQHVHAAAAVGQVERRVALAALELEHGERGRESRRRWPSCSRRGAPRRRRGRRGRAVRLSGNSDIGVALL